MFRFHCRASASCYANRRSLAALLLLLIAVVPAVVAPASAAPAIPRSSRTSERGSENTEQLVHPSSLHDSHISSPSITSMSAGLARDVRVYANGSIVDLPGVSASISLGAGQSVHVYAKGTATSSTTGNLMQGMGVVCAAESLWTTRNHEGSDAYPSTNGHLAVPVRFLFTAPVAGTYTCTLRARVLSSSAPSSFLTFKAGTTNTAISLSAPLVGSAKWGTENDYKDHYFGGAGYDSTAVHVGPGLPAGLAEYALRSSWTASDRASSIDALGDVELTVCYNGTGSCPAYAHGAESIKYAGSVVDTRLLVQQMSNTTPSVPCAITYAPASGYERTTITTNAHHLKVFHRATAPIHPDCGTSRRFAIKVEVKWISGNPIRIEAGHTTSGYSIGIAHNN